MGEKCEETRGAAALMWQGRFCGERVNESAPRNTCSFPLAGVVAILCSAVRFPSATARPCWLGRAMFRSSSALLGIRTVTFSPPARKRSTSEPRGAPTECACETLESAETKKCSNKEHAVDPMCSGRAVFAFASRRSARLPLLLLPPCGAAGASGDRRQVSSFSSLLGGSQDGRGGVSPCVTPREVNGAPALRTCRRRRRRQSRRSRRRSCGRAAAPSSADGGAVFPSGSSGRSAFGMHPTVDVSACESASFQVQEKKETPPVVVAAPPAARVHPSPPLI